MFPGVVDVALTIFIHISSTLQEAITRITSECIEDCARLGRLCYAELCFSPYFLAGPNLSVDNVVQTIVETTRSVSQQHGIVVRLILSILRHLPETAKGVLDLAIKYQKEGVVAIDVAVNKWIGEELKFCQEAMGLTKAELEQCKRNAAKAAFLETEEAKEALLNHMFG
ncbi:hypothetical protein X801_03264 [Opisthorchis viverrini]|uniref:adenosine deaminase n=1 Tax=Opisthorchis viverrini TaxID=6198 RepID=A0A1S8X2E4_OPIVI|nr:hypothetical protein X801_03264 [Opisthorchis viverrini]